MNNKQVMFAAVDAHRAEILAAERYIWQHPETGFREWETHAYLKEKFEALGCTLTEPGDIPGFWVDFDTGRPGPRVAVFGEMDALIIPEHPEAHPVRHTVHACGHNAQCAALYGIAAALSAPGALDGLSGSIRLIAVPAEELIEVEYRSGLIREGKLHAFGGKPEFLLRGYLDDCDMAFMVHLDSRFTLTPGSNGVIAKRYIFLGKASHAAIPHNGRNALYAATNAMNAVNALRETFRAADKVRFHPIITHGGDSVNVIPDRVVIETYVRGRTLAAMEAVNRQVNRAFAAAAAGMGCSLRIEDRFGYAPRSDDKNLTAVMADAAREFLPEDQLSLHGSFEAGSTDMGDISCVMPVLHPYIGGAKGGGHSVNYRVADPEMACVTNAKIQLGALARLLENDAALASKVLAEKKVPFASVAEYREMLERFTFEGDAVVYNDDGTVTLRTGN